GGGISCLSRRYGLAANSVTAIELVNAEGESVRADADQNADLFWALRGGGGSFGVVTALEFALYPITDVHAGVLFFPLERGAEVLRAWRRWVDTVPDEVTSVGRFLQFPPVPALPEHLRGQSFAVIEAASLLGQNALAPWDAGRAYSNFATKRERGERLFGDLTYRRLQTVKATVDPDDVFRSNHPVRLPATEVRQAA